MKKVSLEKTTICKLLHLARCSGMFIKKKEHQLSDVESDMYDLMRNDYEQEIFDILSGHGLNTDELEEELNELIDREKNGACSNRILKVKDELTSDISKPMKSSFEN